LRFLAFEGAWKAFPDYCAERDRAEVAISVIFELLTMRTALLWAV
jgi:hypothetical protein